MSDYAGLQLAGDVHLRRSMRPTVKLPILCTNCNSRYRMADDVYGHKCTSRKRRPWLLLPIAIGLFFGLQACGDNAPADLCRVEVGETIGYQDCGVSGCVALCGVLPSSGEGHLLPVGCTVEIGTATTAPALCVANCTECK